MKSLYTVKTILAVLLLLGCWGGMSVAYGQTSGCVLDCGDTCSITKPGGLYPTDDALARAPITLTWNAPTTTAISDYKVDIRKVGTESVIESQGGLSSSTSSYTVQSTLQIGATYEWKLTVTQTNAVCTKASGWKSFVVQDDPPGTPTLQSPGNDVTVSSNPVLEWDAVARADAYIVEVSRDASMNIVEVRDSTTTTSFQPQLYDGYEYFWQVTAKNNGGATASSLLRFTTDVPEPSVPTLISPGDTDKGLSTTPTFSWNQADGAFGYEVAVETPSGSQVWTEEIGAGVNTTWQIQSGELNRESTYTWKVRSFRYAQDGGCENQQQLCDGMVTDTTYSNWSSSNTFSTLPNPPGAPTLDSPQDNRTERATDLSLHWSSGGGVVDSFRVEVSRSRTFTPAERIVSTTSTSVPAVSPDLEEGFEYFWRVLAINDAAVTSSVKYSFTTDVSEPQVPTLLTPADNSTYVPLQPTLTWDGPNDAMGYEVEILDSSGQRVELYDTGSAINDSWSVASGMLSRESDYTWRVRAYRYAQDAGCQNQQELCDGMVTDTTSGAWSSSNAFTTIPNPPGSPTLVAPSPVTNAVDVPLQPELDWNAASGVVSSYRVVVKGAGGTVIETETLTGTSYTPTTQLDRLTTYTWSVRAANDIDMSPDSSIGQFTTVPPTPGPVSGLSPTQFDTVDVAPTLSWQAGGGRTDAYDIEFRVVGGPSWSSLPSFGETVSLSSLQTNTDYEWRVRSKNAGGPSAWVGSGFTTEPDPPGAPSLMAPADGSIGYDLNVPVEWAPASGVVNRYKIEWKSETESWGNAEMEYAGKQATRDTIQVPSFATVYDIRIVAQNASAQDTPSGVHSFETGYAPPTKIYPQPESGVETPVTFMWDTYANATGYNLQVRSVSASGATNIVVDVSETGTERAITSLSTGANYQWRLRAFIPSGTGGTLWTDWSDFETVYISPLAGERPDATLHSVKSESFLAPVSSRTTAYMLDGRFRSASANYTDGLGRRVQSLKQQASPSGHDIVTPILYDDLGRQTLSLLPYVANGSTAGYYDEASGQQYDFYADPSSIEGMPATNDAYSQKMLEMSPAEKVIEQGAPGALWQPDATPPSSPSDTSHTTRTLHDTNGDGVVPRFVASGGSLQLDGTYAAGMLAKTTVIDPNGNRSITYTDRSGNDIRKVNILDGNPVVTHYVYDDWGRRVWVLPPRAMEMIETGDSAQLAADTWGSRYEYDEYGRQVAKYLPEEEAVTTVYDRLGRVILRQDGLIRQNSDWLFTKYDAYGRTVMTGIYRANELQPRATSRADMQAYVDGLQNGSAPDRLHERPATSDDAQTKYGYTDTTFPTEDPFRIGEELYVWTVTDYDDYDFNQDGTDDAAFEDQDFPAGGGLVTTGSGDVYTDAFRAFDQIRGKTTRTRVRVLGNETAGEDQPVSSEPEPEPIQPFPCLTTICPPLSPPLYTTSDVTTLSEPTDGQTSQTSTSSGSEGSVQWVTNVPFYDKKGRTIQTQRTGPVSTTRTSTRYLFDGRVHATKTTHNRTDGVEEIPTYGSELVVTRTNEYTDQGRIKRTLQRIEGSSTEVIVAETRYNAIGTPVEVKKHSTDGGQTFAFTETRESNVRGWTTRKTVRDTGLLYEHRLGYEDAAYPRFGGSIARMQWEMGGEGEYHSYDYVYDDLGRMTAAEYDGELGGTGSFDQTAAYDNHGNLTNLTRYTASGQIDDLSYSYDGFGNQLTDVEDATGNAEGFTDGNLASGTQAYTYDPNGNLLEDRHKGLSVAYNYLNVPNEIDFGDGRRIQWTYTANGSKLERRVLDSQGVVSSKRYAGGFTYLDPDGTGSAAETLDFFGHGAGRVKYYAGSGGGSERVAYEYAFKDHLGNTRLLVDPDGAGIMQASAYYPYGLRIGGLHQGLIDATGPSTNEELYNGKELTDAHGLNWYHYGARFYNVEIARWTTMDPADEFHTPYTYVGGDPVNLVDPDGMASRVAQQCPPCNFEGTLRQTFGWAEGGVNRASRKASDASDQVGKFLVNAGEAANSGFQSFLESAPPVLDQVSQAMAVTAITAATINLSTTGGPAIPSPDDPIMGSIASGAAVISTGAAVTSTALNGTDLLLYGGSAEEFANFKVKVAILSVGLSGGTIGSAVVRESARATSRSLPAGAEAGAGAAASVTSTTLLKKGVENAGN